MLCLCKVEHIKDHLPQACPHGDSMILDCEVLMVDNSTGKPLPFGTLGIHKVYVENAYKDTYAQDFSKIRLVGLG